MTHSTCEHCGAALRVHRHSLNETLTFGLRALSEAGGGPINLKYLKLTRSQWDNFHKLRYFDLAEKSLDPNGARLGGHWNLTSKGTLFVSGVWACQSRVTTFRGKVIERRGPSLFIDDVEGGA